MWSNTKRKYIHWFFCLMYQNNGMYTLDHKITRTQSQKSICECNPVLFGLHTPLGFSIRIDPTYIILHSFLPTFLESLHLHIWFPPHFWSIIHFTRLWWFLWNLLNKNKIIKTYISLQETYTKHLKKTCRTRDFGFVSFREELEAVTTTPSVGRP